MRLIPCSIGPAAPLPILTGTIQAGFPKASEQFEKSSLSLNELLIQHKSSTFFALAENYDFESAGIYQGDILIVDASVATRSGDIIICEVMGDLLCARLLGGQLIVESNGQQTSINFDESILLKGVVMHSVRIHRPLPNSQKIFESDILDLHRTIIENADATYLAWAEGQSMESVGIIEGDLLIIDRSLDVRNNDIVIANIENQFTCKRLDLEKGLFVAESSEAFSSIPFTNHTSLAGIVSKSIRMHRTSSIL